MNYLLILYEPTLYDKFITFLKRKFKTDLPAVAVEELFKDQLIQFTWEGLHDPNDLATELTELFPTLVIESNGNSGLESRSRYFNKTQLW